MRAIVAFFAFALWAGQVNSVEQKAWRCITEKSVGASTTKGAIRSVSFSNLEEYRIKPSGEWVNDLEDDPLWPDFRYAEESVQGRLDKGARRISLIRNVKRDPKLVTSWSACAVGEFGWPSEHNLIFCETSVWAGTPDFRFKDHTGRFTSVRWGDWYSTVLDQPEADSVFEFGSCTPHYD